MGSNVSDRIKLIIFGVFACICLHGVLFPLRIHAMSSQTVTALVNEQRQEAGLQPLADISSLEHSSLAKAGDMFAKNYWSHNAPDGSEPWHFFDESGYTYTVAGENLAKNFTTPAGVVIGWMNSPTHRANVLNTEYTDIGISAVDGVLLGEHTTLIVAHFGAHLTTQPKVVKKTEPAATGQPAVAGSDKVPANVPRVDATPPIEPEKSLGIWQRLIHDISTSFEPRDLLFLS
jgi:hypothetical protein